MTVIFNMDASKTEWRAQGSTTSIVSSIAKKKHLATHSHHNRSEHKIIVSDYGGEEGHYSCCVKLEGNETGNNMI